LRRLFVLFVCVVVSLSVFGQASAGGPDPTALHSQPPTAYLLWSSFNSTTFAGTNTAGIGTIFNPPISVNVQTVDIALATAAVGCTTSPVLSLYDVTATPAEVDPSFETTLVNGQRIFNNTPNTPFPLQANHAYMWGIKTAAAGCTTSPAGPSITLGYTMNTADLTVSPSGGGTTVVVNMVNTTDTTQFEKVVCQLPNCNPGGNTPPVATSLTAGTITSPPTATTLGQTTSLTAPATDATHTAQVNVLWTEHFTPCDSCTTFQNDFWERPSANAVAWNVNLESDHAMFDSTDGLDFMFGLQCNLAGHKWQIDNQADPWIDAISSGSVVPCNMTAGTWYYVQLNTHRTVGDTACSLANTNGVGTTPGPCVYFDKLIVQPFGGSATTYILNQKMRAAFLHSGWSSGTYSQKQTDLFQPNSTAQRTVTMEYTADHFQASK